MWVYVWRGSDCRYETRGRNFLFFYFSCCFSCYFFFFVCKVPFRCHPANGTSAETLSEAVGFSFGMARKGGVKG